MKFPDFSLIKIQFPWPDKYKVSDIVAASGLNYSRPFLSWQRQFAFLIKKKHCSDQTDLDCIFQPVNDAKSPVL